MLSTNLRRSVTLSHPIYERTPSTHGTPERIASERLGSAIGLDGLLVFERTRYCSASHECISPSGHSRPAASSREPPVEGGGVQP